MAKITIIHGPTGSGKSLKAQEIRKATGARIYEELLPREDAVLVIPAGVEIDIVETQIQEEK